MDFFSIVCGAASLLWLAAGALAVEDRWRQRRLTKKSTVYCPTCRGVTPQGCPRCGGVGLVVVPATRGDAFRRMSDRELAEELFQFRFDGYAKAQGAETVLPDTIHSIENWLKEEMDE